MLVPHGKEAKMQTRIRAMLYSLATLATLMIAGGARWKPK
jgi:hypothetical protein